MKRECLRLVIAGLGFPGNRRNGSHVLVGMGFFPSGSVFSRSAVLAHMYAKLMILDHGKPVALGYLFNESQSHLVCR